MHPTKLPHEKEEPLEQEPFTTMNNEIARRQSGVHPHYDETDFYGNGPTEKIPIEGRKKDEK